MQLKIFLPNFACSLSLSLCLALSLSFNITVMNPNTWTWDCGADTKRLFDCFFWLLNPQPPVHAWRHRCMVHGENNEICKRPNPQPPTSGIDDLSCSDSVDAAESRFYVINGRHLSVFVFQRRWKRIRKNHLSIPSWVLAVWNFEIFSPPIFGFHSPNKLMVSWDECRKILQVIKRRSVIL